MQWLFENPVGEMWGPAFLAFYAMAFGIALASCWWYRTNLDTSVDLPNLPVPVEPDPYQTAYLRGGESEVLRLATVDLYQRGLLEEHRGRWFSGKQLKAVQSGPNQGSLDAISQAVWEYYQQPHPPAEIFKAGFRPQIASQFERWETWIEAEQLRFPASARASFKTLKYVAVGSFLGLGAYKLLAAINSQHLNVGFLILMMFAGGIGLTTLAKLPRMTSRGRRYIDDLQTAYQTYKSPDWGSAASAQVTSGLGGFSLPVMAVGLFGIAALQHSPYDLLYTQYARASSLGSSCGSSCGSGCGSGGSSCGGASCGGSSCGGGGCGGCGGGD